MRHAYRLARIKLISRGDLRLARSIGRLDVARTHQRVGITDARLVHGQCGRVLVRAQSRRGGRLATVEACPEGGASHGGHSQIYRVERLILRRDALVVGCFQQRVNAANLNHVQGRIHGAANCSALQPGGAHRRRQAHAHGTGYAGHGASQGGSATVNALVAQFLGAVDTQVRTEKHGRSGAARHGIGAGLGQGRKHPVGDLAGHAHRCRVGQIVLGTLAELAGHFAVAHLVNGFPLELVHVGHWLPVDHRHRGGIPIRCCLAVGVEDGRPCAPGGVGRVGEGVSNRTAHPAECTGGFGRLIGALHRLGQRGGPLLGEKFVEHYSPTLRMNGAPPGLRTTSLPAMTR